MINMVNHKIHQILTEQLWHVMVNLMVNLMLNLMVNLWLITLG